MAAQPPIRDTEGYLKPPRGRGRPPGSRNQTSEERRLKVGTTQIDYLRVGNKFKKPEDFYLYLAGYPDKTGLEGSIYRLRPRIDHMLIGIDQSAIHKTSKEAELNEQWISDNFGRGEYHILLNDSNREGTKTVAETWLDLSTLTKPPVYDPRTLILTDMKNMDEINRLVNNGVMVRDRATGHPRIRDDGDGPPTPANAHPAAASNPLGSLDLGAIVTHMLTTGARNTHDNVRDTIEVAKLLQPPVMDVEAAVEKVLTRLGVGAGGRPLDPLDIYEKMESRLDRLRPHLVGDGSGFRSAADAWGPHLPGIVREARGLWGEIVAGIKDLRGARTETAPNQNGGQRMPQVLPYEQRMEAILKLGFEEMQKGTKGYDFAAYVCGFYPGGLEVFVNLDPVGAPGVIGSLAMNPQTRTLVNDPNIRPQLEEFLTSFFEFDASPLLTPAPSPAPGPATS